MQPPPGLGPCVLRPWGPPPFRLPGSGATWSLPREGAATVRGLSFHHRGTTCSCGNRKTRTQPPAPAPCARLPCGSPAATVRVRVRLAPGCAPRSRAVTCALVALVWRRDHVLDYQVSPPRCMPLLAFREAWPTVSAGLLSVSAPAPPAGDAAAHQAVRSPGHSLPLPPRPGVSPEAPGQHLRPREPQHPPSPGASPPPKGWTHVTFLFLSGMFQAEASPTPCPSSPLSVGL